MSGRQKTTTSNRKDIKHELWLPSDHSLADYIRLPSTTRHNTELTAEDQKKMRSSSRHARPVGPAPDSNHRKHSKRDRSMSVPVIPSINDSSQYQSKAPPTATTPAPTTSSYGRGHEGHGEAYNLRNYLKKRADRQSPRSSNEKVVNMEDEKTLRFTRQSRSQAIYGTTTSAPHGAVSTQTFTIPSEAPIQPIRDPASSRPPADRDRVKEKEREQRRRQRDDDITKPGMTAAEVEAERERSRRRAAREKDRVPRERERVREHDGRRIGEDTGSQPVNPSNPHLPITVPPASNPAADSRSAAPATGRTSRSTAASVQHESQAQRPRPPRSRRDGGANGQESGMSSSEQEVANRERSTIRRYHHTREPTADPHQSSSEGERALAREQRKPRRTHDGASSSRAYAVEDTGHDYRTHTREPNHRTTQVRESPLQRSGTALPSAVMSTTLPLANASQPTANVGHSSQPFRSYVVSIRAGQGPADPQTPRLHPRSGSTGASTYPDHERMQSHDTSGRSQPASGFSQSSTPYMPHKSNTHSSLQARGDIGLMSASQDISIHDPRQQWQAGQVTPSGGYTHDTNDLSTRVADGLVRPASAKPAGSHSGQAVDGSRSRGDGIVRPPTASGGHRSTQASTSYLESRIHTQETGRAVAQTSSSRSHPSPGLRPTAKVEESPRAFASGVQQVSSDRDRATAVPSAPQAGSGSNHLRQPPPSYCMPSSTPQDPRGSETAGTTFVTWMQPQRLPDGSREDVKGHPTQAVVNVAVVHAAIPAKPVHSHSPSHGAQHISGHSPALHSAQFVTHTPKHSPSARLLNHINGSSDTIHVSSQRPSPLNPVGAELPRRSSATSLRPNGTPRAEMTTMPRTTTTSTGYPDLRYRPIPTPVHAPPSVSVPSEVPQSSDLNSSRPEPPGTSNHPFRHASSSYAPVRDVSATATLTTAAQHSSIPSVPSGAPYSPRARDPTFPSSSHRDTDTIASGDHIQRHVRSLSSPPPPTQVRQQVATGLPRTVQTTTPTQPVRNNTFPSARLDVFTASSSHSLHDSVPRRAPTPGHVASAVKASRVEQDLTESTCPDHVDAPLTAGLARGGPSSGPPLVPSSQSRGRLSKDKEAKKRGGLFGLLRSLSSPPKQEERPAPSTAIFGRKRLNSNPTQHAASANSAAPQPAATVRSDTAQPVQPSHGVPLRTVESTPSAPAEHTAEYNLPPPIVSPTPVQAGGRSRSPSKGMPYRLVSRRHRTVSAASVGAVDGSMVNTVLTGGESTRSSTVGRPSPPLRDPLAAAHEWRDKEEAEFFGRPSNRRRRPGVVFDVEEDPDEDRRPTRRPVPRRQQTIQVEA